MLIKVLPLTISAIIICAVATSCQRADVELQTAPRNEMNAQAEVVSMKSSATESPKGCSKTSEGVAGLPYAHGKVFPTLDEYLAHLQQLGALDLPYWRQIRPGVYEQVIHMPGAVPETATREGLLAKYCFDSE